MKIQLRLIELGDAARLYEILSNPSFALFSSAPKSITDELIWIKENFNSVANGTSYHYVILLDNEIIGGIGVKVCLHRKYIGEIGYFIEEKYWGKGFAVEAVKLLEEKCFKFLKLTRLEAIMQPLNVNSEKVVIKSGYKKEGLLSKIIKGKDGVMKDAYLYAKTL